jgi:hypothetical protein
MGRASGQVGYYMRFGRAVPRFPNRTGVTGGVRPHEVSEAGRLSPH